MSDLIDRQAAIQHLKKRLYETALNNITEHPYYEELADNRVDVWLNELPSAQPVIRTEMSSTNDTISRQMAIEYYQVCCRRTSCAECPLHIKVTDRLTDCELELFLHNLPSVQPEGWMERNKERILQAGREGREIEFRIGGRLFAIREKAQ